MFDGSCQHALLTFKFTGKERDSESGLDNFGARYDSSSMGRFITPDWSDEPEPVPYADLGIPQTLNLYAFTGNNPISGTDYDGHDPGCGSGSSPCPAAKMPLLPAIRRALFQSAPRTRGTKGQ